MTSRVIQIPVTLWEKFPRVTLPMASGRPDTRWWGKQGILCSLLIPVSQDISPTPAK